MNLNNLKKIPFILPGLIILFSTLACTTNTTPVSEKKSVVVTYSILGSIVKELAGDKVDVIISIPNGLDPHDWEPSAKDIEALNKADLIIQNGLGLEGGVEKSLAAAQNQGVKMFVASDHITIRYVGPGEGIPSGDPDQAIGAADPHLWTDPLTIKSLVAALAAELKKDFNLDVSTQAKDLQRRLDSLNAEIVDVLNVIPSTDRKLVTGHESMGYFAQRYGFILVGVIVPSLSSQAGVSAADLAALKQTVEANHIKAIFTELGTSPAAAQVIGNETGVKVIELSTHVLPEDGSYFTFMKDMANVIANALK
jgi:zinc/manganese transport system substrate-binding protein